MKKFLFPFIFVALISPVFSEPSIELKNDIDSSVFTAAKTLTGALPEASLMMNTEPDAFIGKMYPSIPPHFTAGTNFGGTLITTTDITSAITKMNTAINADMSAQAALKSINIPDQIVQFVPSFALPEKFIIPTAAASIRLGGIVIPFDLGLFGIANIPNVLTDISLGNISINAEYLCLGADIRFALYEGGTIMPKISMGFGYIYSKNSFGFGVSNSDSNYTYDTDKKGTLISSYKINLNIDYQTFYTQLQVSKKLACFIPYVGIRAHYTINNSSYDWKYDTSITDNTDSSVTINTADSNSYSFAKTLEDFRINTESINPTLYGGLGIKAPFFEFGMNAAWNISTKDLSFGILSTFKL